MQYCPNCNNTFVIVKAVQNEENKALFKCTNCEHVEPIKPHTKIISRSMKKDTDVKENNNKYKDIIYDSTLPHTRNYICPNKKCASHDDHTKRDAVWIKPTTNSYKTVYVCTSCKTVF